MESNEHSEGSSDSEEDNDDIQLRDRDVDLREKVEIFNGRLRRKAVSANFVDDVDDEVCCFPLIPCHGCFFLPQAIAYQFMNPCRAWFSLY